MKKLLFPFLLLAAIALSVLIFATPKKAAAKDIEYTIGIIDDYFANKITASKAYGALKQQEEELKGTHWQASRKIYSAAYALRQAAHSTADGQEANKRCRELREYLLGLLE